MPGTDILRGLLSPAIQRPLTYAGGTLRILMVIDGRITLNHDEFGFGLGFVIDTLRSSWLNSVRIELELATREPTIDDYSSDGFRVHTGFRFDQAGFRIDDWHQIWIFADQPSDAESDRDDLDELIAAHALSTQEVRVLAEWMDRGGGVFATGDHNALGASACYRIPRVRTMRKWRSADGVPSRSGPRRNQTLQEPLFDFDDRDSEADALLQPLELVYTQSVKSWPFDFIKHPHPVLSSSRGSIDRFPDHMHEGELVADDEVQLDRPIDIPHYPRPEYPPAGPSSLTNSLGTVAAPSWQPRPGIIAYGRTTNPTYSDLPASRPASLFETLLGRRKRFGIVSVYDGEPANVGRIVCDSTWHHWFSGNLSGIVPLNSLAYFKMQSYYRNVALWLSNASQRRQLMTASVWNVLAHSSPMDFNAAQTHWEMGQLVIERMTPMLGASWVNELAASHVDATRLYRTNPPVHGVGRPEWGRLPEDVVNRVVVGSLAKALYPQVRELRRDLTRKTDVRVDEEAVEKLVSEATARVPGLLSEAIAESIDGMTRLRESLGSRRD